VAENERKSKFLPKKKSARPKLVPKIFFQELSQASGKLLLSSCWGIEEAPCWRNKRKGALKVVA